MTSRAETIWAVVGGAILLSTPVAVISSRAFGVPRLAQNSTKPQEPVSEPTSACDKPEFRQFDFWLGVWLVRDPQGKEIGESGITSVAGGCALRESWKSSRGITGTSINYYDRDTGHWHQHWVGSDGSVLHLEGGLQDGAMVLSGPGKDAAGVLVENRITWTALRDGKVKQEWATSSDSGNTWKTDFLGLYER